MDEDVSSDPKVRAHLQMKTEGMQRGRDGSESSALTNLPWRGSRLRLMKAPMHPAPTDNDTSRSGGDPLPSCMSAMFLSSAWGCYVFLKKHISNSYKCLSHQKE